MVSLPPWPGTALSVTAVMAVPRPKRDCDSLTASRSGRMVASILQTPPIIGSAGWDQMALLPPWPGTALPATAVTAVPRRQHGCGVPAGLSWDQTVAFILPTLKIAASVALLQTGLLQRQQALLEVAQLAVTGAPQLRRLSFYQKLSGSERMAVS